MLLQLSEFRRHKNSSSPRGGGGRRTKTDSAPPSGVPRDLLLCHWAMHTQMPSRNAPTPSTRVTNRLSSSTLQQVGLKLSRLHITSPATTHLWPSDRLSSSRRTLSYYGLIQHCSGCLPLLEHRASHLFERIETSIIERVIQPLESQTKSSQLLSSVQLPAQHTLELLGASSHNLARLETAFGFLKSSTLSHSTSPTLLQIRQSHRRFEPRASFSQRTMSTVPS